MYLINKVTLLSGRPWPMPIGLGAWLERSGSASGGRMGRIVAEENSSADSPKIYSINNCAVNSLRRCWPVYCWLMPMAFKLYSCKQSNTLMVLGKV